MPPGAGPGGFRCRRWRRGSRCPRWGPGSRARAAAVPVAGGEGRAGPSRAGLGGEASCLPFPLPPLSLRLPSPPRSPRAAPPAGAARSSRLRLLGRCLPGRGGPGAAAGAGSGERGQPSCEVPKCPRSGESPRRRVPSGWALMYLFNLNMWIMSFILCYFSLWKEKKKPLPLQRASAEELP